MALSKTSLVFSMSMIVLVALVVEVADAEYISYGALDRDGKLCGNPAGCNYDSEIPANPYNRGYVGDAKLISYGAMTHDGTICAKRGGCTEPDIPQNPYNRGCEASHRCRGGGLDHPKGN
ncbi:hypothetical protein AgCh_025419 [Apium graveolens]